MRELGAGYFFLPKKMFGNDGSGKPGGIVPAGKKSGLPGFREARYYTRLNWQGLLKKQTSSTVAVVLWNRTRS